MQFQQTPPPVPEPKKAFPWIPVLIGAAVLCLLCVGAVLFVVLGKDLLGEVGLLGRATATVMVPSEVAELPPTATAPPAPTPTEDTSQAETATQHALDVAATQTAESVPTETTTPEATATEFVTGEVFFDTFSEVNPDWLLVDDEHGTAEIRDGALYLKIHEADNWIEVNIPADFPISQVSFNITNIQIPFDGTFGVFCRSHDGDNEFYAELTVPYGYIFGYVENGEGTNLTGTESEPWTKVSGLRSRQGDVNHIDVVCGSDAIALFLNGSQVASTSFPITLADLSSAGLYVYSYEPDEDGFEVKIDDLQVYEIPVLKPDW